MDIQLENYHQPASKKVILAMSGKIFDESAIKIILFATEGGVACKKTAERIADEIEKSPDKTSTMLQLIKNELNMNSYFHPTPRIKELINSLSQQ